MNVNLQKMKKAETWPGALQGRNASVDPVTLGEMQKKIMLERFQNEVRCEERVVVCEGGRGVWEGKGGQARRPRAVTA